MNRELIKKGEQVRILPKWQDAGDEEYDWFAFEDETSNGYLRVRSKKNGQPVIGIMTVESRMIERANP